MDITIEEIGRKISTANEQKIRAAMSSLQGIMSLLMHADGDQPDPEAKDEGDPKKTKGKEKEQAAGTIAARLVPATEAASPRGKTPTLDEIRASLQKLINTLPADAREDLEGDMDGDGDPDNVRLQTRVGEALRGGILGYINEMLSEPLQESPGPPMEPHGAESHPASFPKLGGDAQAQHLQDKHNVPDAHPALQAPGKRVAMHAADHAANPFAKGGAPAKEAVTFETEFVPLTEGAVGRDGVFEMKIIRPGWGSSGYYSPDLLKRDGPKVFTEGVKMYWDHPTPEEAVARPERSLRDLAAELVTQAKYVESHKNGPGLYANAKALQGYGERINDLAPHIGVSIRADGEGRQGTAEGKSGRIIEAITRARSTDFVTVPGAGGKICSLFEAARPNSTEENDVDLTEARKQLDEANTELARLREAVVLREAQDIAGTELAKTDGLPAVTVRRLTESLGKNPPMKDGALDKDAFAKVITETVKSELAYLSDVLGTGRVSGMGGSGSGNGSAGSADLSKYEESLVESFKSLGLDESTAKLAAHGR